jgi:hypothetical protein
MVDLYSTLRQVGLLGLMNLLPARPPVILPKFIGLRIISWFPLWRTSDIGCLLKVDTSRIKNQTTPRLTPIQKSPIDVLSG